MRCRKRTLCAMAGRLFFVGTGAASIQHRAELGRPPGTVGRGDFLLPCRCVRPFFGNGGLREPTPAVGRGAEIGLYWLGWRIRG